MIPVAHRNRIRHIVNFHHEQEKNVFQNIWTFLRGDCMIYFHAVLGNIPHLTIYDLICFSLIDTFAYGYTECS